ncbi:MAG TPA: hypothetical protein DHW14_04395 [Clostridiales bacterium]|nr:hypothetical protein [Clostridiales bacterium]
MVTKPERGVPCRDPRGQCTTVSLERHPSGARIGNVSQACREAGLSRTLFYRWRARYLAEGPDGLTPRPRTRALLGRTVRQLPSAHTWMQERPKEVVTLGHPSQDTAEERPPP